MDLAALKDFIGALGALLTIVAIIVGGIWSYLLFIRTRQHYPRANLIHHIVHKSITKDKTLLHVAATISNAGDILLQLASGETRVQQVTPSPPDILKVIRQDQDPVARGQTEIEWPLIGHRQAQWSKGQFEIEPGESDTFACDFIVDADVESVSVYSYFKNEEKRERELGWSVTTHYDLKKEEE